MGALVFGSAKASLVADHLQHQEVISIYFSCTVCNSGKSLLAQICRSKWKRYIATLDNSLYSPATVIQNSGGVELEN